MSIKLNNYSALSTTFVAYSTWYNLPSGEKIAVDQSYFIFREFKKYI